MMTSKPNCQHHMQQHKIASPGGTGIQKNFTFLPMLCSTSSTKQVKLTHRRCSSSSSSTVTEEPSSPKVGCMGQVKRNNKVVNFPSIISFTTSTTTTSSNSSGSTNHHVIKCHATNNYTSNSIIKYHKIKRFFSTKSPTSVIAVTRPSACGSHKGKIGRKNNIGSNNIVCRSKVNNKNINSGNNENGENDKGSLINLVEMDPPLPVTKKVVKREQGNGDGESASTLWKRRSGGAPLKSLRVEVIQQNLSLLPANTV